MVVKKFLHTVARKKNWVPSSTTASSGSRVSCTERAIESYMSEDWLPSRLVVLTFHTTWAAGSGLATTMEAARACASHMVGPPRDLNVRRSSCVSKPFSLPTRLKIAVMWLGKVSLRRFSRLRPHALRFEYALIWKRIFVYIYTYIHTQRKHKNFGYTHAYIYVYI